MCLNEGDTVLPQSTACLNNLGATVSLEADVCPVTTGMPAAMAPFVSAYVSLVKTLHSHCLLLVMFIEPDCMALSVYLRSPVATM